MKKSHHIMSCLIILLVLGPQLFIFQHIKSQKRLLYRQVMEIEEKMASFKKLRANIELASKKMLALEKKHPAELASLKENKLESLFYATQLAHQFQLKLMKSTIGEDQLITVTLSGGLENFSLFLTRFSRSPKALHLISIIINANPTLTFKVDWQVPTI